MKAGICTLGCKVNTYESEFVVSLLQKAGYKIVDFHEMADVYIINTCTVTNTSDIKSRKMIRQAKRRNSFACVVAMGCFIQAELENIIPEIDIAIGNCDKGKIVELLDLFFAHKEKIINYQTDFDRSFEDMYIEKYEHKTRAFIKIQDGCENYCSYCIIPYVRGKCRSKSIDIVMREATVLVHNGFHEIVLTGIHTGNYGVDLNTNFAFLLQQLVQINGLCRLRISSIEINELTDEVLDIIGTHEVIVDHLHIPIQAASDEVLSLMRRKYNLDLFCKRIEKIRKIRPNISITTDIIVGHPGETEEEFQRGIEFLYKIGFSKLHVFPYSKRKGTKSASMEQISDDIKKRRARELLDLSRKLELKYMSRFLHKKVQVLVESCCDGYVLGHTTNYLSVKICSNLWKSGDLVMVELVEIDYPWMIGIVG